jgi:hypothetical protein
LVLPGITRDEPVLVVLRPQRRSEVQGCFDALINTQSNANLSIDQFVAQGETVVAIGRYAATVKPTGKPINTLLSLHSRYRTGRLVGTW